MAFTSGECFVWCAPQGGWLTACVTFSIFVLVLVRRAWFFGVDLGVAALHFGRSLLGQEALELSDTILRSISLEYCSLEGVLRDEAAGALRK